MPLWTEYIIGDDPYEESNNLIDKIGDEDTVDDWLEEDDLKEDLQ